MDRSIGDMPTSPGSHDREREGVLRPGMVFGRHKVHRLLGRGGMGEVYEVEHELDGRHYAMKVLSEEVHQSPENVERFECEAKVMARLQHPNITRVDYFDETDGKYWFRMELANGIEEGVVTLEDLAAKNGGRIGQSMMAGLFVQILDGLMCAHNGGVIHRDLKPSNILLTHSKETSGRLVPRISDFGLVCLVGQEWLLNKTRLSYVQSLGERDTVGPTSAQGLSTQSLVGTYAYMAPEQKQQRPVDARSDLYAVGLMIYRLLTGYTSPGEKMKRKDPTLHAFWQRIVDQSVREDADDRYASAAAMFTDLQRGRRVLASVDGPAMIRKCRAELTQKRCYTANRHLDDAVVMLPQNLEVQELTVTLREQLSLLQRLKNRIIGLKQKQDYDQAFQQAQAFYDKCIEDEWINRFIERCPQLIKQKELDALAEQATGFLKTKDYDQASEVLASAMSLVDEEGQAVEAPLPAVTRLQKLQRLCVRERVRRGLQEARLALKQRHFTRAKGALDQVLQWDEHNADAASLLKECQTGLERVEAYWQKAEAARSSQDYRSAKTYLKEILQNVSPDDPDTASRLDRMRSEQKQFATALADMNRAGKEKCFRDCLNAAEQVLAIHSQHAVALKFKGICQDKLADVESALERAEVQLRAQRYDDALTAFKEARRYYALESPEENQRDSDTTSPRAVYSPEAGRITERIEVAHKAKLLTEQTIERARGALKAGKLQNAQQALEDYFQLQPEGSEGLALQKEWKRRQRRAQRRQRLRRMILSVAAVLVVGVGLAYVAAGLLLSHQQQRDLESSRNSLSLKVFTQAPDVVDGYLNSLRYAWIVRLPSVQQAWSDWQANLVQSQAAWDDYTHGAYQNGQQKLVGLQPDEDRSAIQGVFNDFVAFVDPCCAYANSCREEGRYEAGFQGVRSLLAEYPEHQSLLDVNELLSAADRLEHRLWDSNTPLLELDGIMRRLRELSPRHHRWRELEQACIRRYRESLVFLDQDIPENRRTLEVEEKRCQSALDEIAPFVRYAGYTSLSRHLQDRRDKLILALGKVNEDEVLTRKLSEIQHLVRSRFLGKAESSLDVLEKQYPGHPDVEPIRSDLYEKIRQVDQLLLLARTHFNGGNNDEVRDAIAKLWDKCDRNDTLALLGEVAQLEKDLDSQVDVALNKREAFQQTMQRALDAYTIKHIDTAQKHLADCRMLFDAIQDKALKESFISHANDIDGAAFQAEELTKQARVARDTGRYAESLWIVHKALSINREWGTAIELKAFLEGEERAGTHDREEALILIRMKYYFTAQRKIEDAERFPGDLRTQALDRIVETKIKQAHVDAALIGSKRMSVKDFYDRYPDYAGFQADVPEKVKTAIQSDLEKRLEDRSKKAYHKLQIEARRGVLGDTVVNGLLRNASTGRLSSEGNGSSGNAQWCRLTVSEIPADVNIILELETKEYSQAITSAPAVVFVPYRDQVTIRIRKTQTLTGRTLARSEIVRGLTAWGEQKIEINPTCWQEQTVAITVLKGAFGRLKRKDMINTLMSEPGFINRRSTQGWGNDRATEYANHCLDSALKEKKKHAKNETLYVKLIEDWVYPEFLAYVKAEE